MLVPVVLRAVFVLAWLLIGLNALTQAREVPLGQLAADLAQGQVTSIEVERVAPGDTAQGSFSVRWDAGLIDSFARYEYQPQQGIDEVAPMLEQARAGGVPVQVVYFGQYPDLDMVTSEGWIARSFGPAAILFALFTVAGSWIMLVTSSQPWLATKWAWFWLLVAVPALWPVFLALEPRPLRLSLHLARAGLVPQRVPSLVENRLTGGWALVIGWVLAALLSAVGMPQLSAWA